MYQPRLKEKYRKEVVPALMKKRGYKSVMSVPALVKICINRGLGRGVSDKKLIELGAEELSLIAGQRAVVTRAKRSISNFKLREGMPVGVRVVLRCDRMYEFFDRLISIALPRVRDFRGTNPKSFDGRGNYTLGVKEQIVFPEISVDKVGVISGMDITFVTSAKTDEEARDLLLSFGMPLRTG